MTDPDVLKKLASLSNRQREVFMMVCQGAEYKDIAKKLFIVESTVKAHMGNVYIKLGLDQMNDTLRLKTYIRDLLPGDEGIRLNPTTARTCRS